MSKGGVQNIEHEAIRRELQKYLRDRGWFVRNYWIGNRNLPVDLYARKQRAAIAEIKTGEEGPTRLDALQKATGQLVLGAIHAHHLLLVVPDSWTDWIEQNRWFKEELDRLIITNENIEGQRKTYYDKRIKLFTVAQFKSWADSLQ